MPKFKDLKGQCFSRLTVISVAHKGGDGAYFWNCQCVCGRNKAIRGASLKDGSTKSCGCLAAEKAAIHLSKLRFKDLAGQIFGRFTVIDVADKTKLGAYRWNCKCDCGQIKKVISYNLLNGNSQSCGCLQRENTSRAKFKDLTNQRFGKLAAISVARQNKQHNYFWNCLCDCGKNKVISSSNLIQGYTNSCGCLHHRPPGVAAQNQLYLRYTKSAKRRNLVWDITKGFFLNTTQQNCFYCGIEPRQIVFSHDNKNGIDYTYNGIDRIDSMKGYTENNCISSCGTCNRAKNNMPYDDWVAWLNRIKNHSLGEIPWRPESEGCLR